MLQYEIAKNLYEEIKEKSLYCNEEIFLDFYKDFLKSAADYAKTRTEWTFMDRKIRLDEDKNRTIKHDGFMSLLGAICRNLDITGIDDIMPDRKTKGDFACYITLFLALEQR